jgi:hypothetical protein
MSDITSLPTEFLFTLSATLAPSSIVPSGPNGTRMIVPITGGTVTGPKINGTLEALGADWLTLREDGTAQLDVRALIRTSDGAMIHTSYKGIMSPDADGKPRIITAPLFETGDERYSWLNSIQAIAVGAPGKNGVTYDVYRLV